MTARALLAIALLTTVARGAGVAVEVYFDSNGNGQRDLWDSLPDVLPIIGFLLIYIALMGPLNYVILNRLNRREWAWVTIPLLIAVFSAPSLTAAPTATRASQ